MKKIPVAVIVGTRPEAIKLAPVIQRLVQSRRLTPVVVSTSQHRELGRQTLKSFDIEVDYELHVMKHSQSLSALSGRLVSRLGEFFRRHDVGAVLIQGDTSSALFGGLCGFYHRLPVGHVEAGLRTHNKYAPFPEEMNRRLLSSIATWHFAPTKQAAQNLAREGIPTLSIYVTGNTVADALQWIAPRCADVRLKELLATKQSYSRSYPAPNEKRNRDHRRLILVTCHRRENLGEPMKRIADGLVDLARRNPDVLILLPLHPNPVVRNMLTQRLGKLPNVRLQRPLTYPDFIACLKHAYLVISDSGGVQEEATALGKPVLVLRTETEREEGVAAGSLKLISTDPRRIVRETERLLNDPTAYRRMSQPSKVFGDGQAASRIIKVIEGALARSKSAAPV